MAKNDVLSHEEPDPEYASPTERIRHFGGANFEITGENVLYSTPQRFPLDKTAVTALAEEMFQSWKKSPPHYANMIGQEYVYGDFGFQVQPTKKVVYATQVFGKKGFVVTGQLSGNAFGLTQGPYKCDESFKYFYNLVLNMGNDVSMEGDVVRLYYHDIESFKKIFENDDDGIAIDLVSRNQMPCGAPNQLDVSPVHDGILLKPVFRNELLRNNEAKSDYRIITVVGKIPPQYRSRNYTPSLVLIRNGQMCKYLVSGDVPSRKYNLKPIQPILRDPGNIALVKQGIIWSQEVEYEFKTNITTSVHFPKVDQEVYPVRTIEITAFSSVEGDSSKNETLHNNRAQAIRAHLQKLTGAPDSVFQIKTAENWDMMRFQLHCFHREDLARLAPDSLKRLIGKDRSLPWDSLFYAQRVSTATIHYSGNSDIFGAGNMATVMNLRTAVLQNNPSLANKALYLMATTDTFNRHILFEKSIFEFIKKHPETATNSAALLASVYQQNIQLTTAFLFNWMGRKNELDADATFNLLHLYTLVGNWLLDEWDVETARLANVVHPAKVNAIANAESISNELMLNLHLTYINYYGQINDGMNISRSFDFIADYFQKRSLRPEDDTALGLFFNSWSRYDKTLSYLYPKFLKNALDEDGLFALVQTTSFYDTREYAEQLLALHEAAVAANLYRWCNWVNEDFQILRDTRIKQMYCEKCMFGHSEGE